MLLHAKRLGLSLRRRPGLVASIRFYPENQHEFLESHGHCSSALPTLARVEHFLDESGSQQDVFQTQDYLIIKASRTIT